MKKDQQFKGKIAEEILINERFRYLHIELVEPYRIEFNAGQYISLDIEKEMANYPIASPPAVNHAVELCVVIKSGGKGADYFKALKPGDEVLFSGPFGNFVVEPEKKTLEKKLLLVATASGIAGIRSIILDLLEEKQDQRPFGLLITIRDCKDSRCKEQNRQDQGEIIICRADIFKGRSDNPPVKAKQAHEERRTDNNLKDNNCNETFEKDRPVRDDEGCSDGGGDSEMKQDELGIKYWSFSG